MDNEMTEVKEEVIVMMYTLWIQKFGLHHSEQLLEAFEFMFEDQKTFMDFVQLAGNICLAKHIQELGL